MNPALKGKIETLFDKKQVTVLIADSGLGGFSIFAEVASRLKTDPIFKRVSLIYYNAWPEQNRGYNRLRDTRERIRVFDRALQGMNAYGPDIIMIACNTLSVLYDRTEFSRRESVPVVDIVGFGVDMVYDSLCAAPASQAVMLGTLTTMASEVHASALKERGIAPVRLVSQPCDQLATEIEKGARSTAVRRLLDIYMPQAVDRLKSAPADVFAALFCTHFGYCRRDIQERLEQGLQRPVTVLDPNRRMAAFLFEASSGYRHEPPAVTMRVLSRIVWEPEKIDTISEIVELRSMEAAEALRNYEHLPGLFTF